MTTQESNIKRHYYQQLHRTLKLILFILIVTVVILFTIFVTIVVNVVVLPQGFDVFFKSLIILLLYSVSPIAATNASLFSL